MGPLCGGAQFQSSGALQFGENTFYRSFFNRDHRDLLLPVQIFYNAVLALALAVTVVVPFGNIIKNSTEHSHN